MNRPPIKLFIYAANVVEMGSAEQSGKALADIIKFLMSRISRDTRPKSLNRLKTKIWAMNEYDMASKKTPASAGMGHSLSFIKNVLNGHNPNYIRSVIKAIVKYL